MGLGSVVDAVTSIADVFIQIGKLLEYLIYALFELFPAFISLFNPINILNDTITGVILSVKVIVTNIIGFFKSKDGGYDKCNDTGSGIFGFRREKNKEGKIVASSDCGGDKTCRKSYLLKYLVAIICPPLALFLYMGASGWFHVIVCTIFTVYFYYFPGLIYALLHIVYLG